MAPDLILNFMKIHYLSIENIFCSPYLQRKKCGIGEGTAMLIGGIAAAAGGTASAIATANAGAAVSEETMGWQTQENQIARDFAGQQQAYAQQHQREMQTMQQEFATDMMNKVNQYNSPVNQLGLMRDAGVTPYAMSGQSFQSMQPSTPSAAGVGAASPSMPNMTGIGQISAALKGKSYEQLSQTLERLGDLAQKIPSVKAEIDLKKATAEKEKWNAKMQETLQKAKDYELVKTMGEDKYLSRMFTWYKNPNSSADTYSDYYSPELFGYVGKDAPEWFKDGMTSLTSEQLPDIVKGYNMRSLINAFTTSQEIISNLSDKRLGLTKNQYAQKVQDIDNMILDQLKGTKDYEDSRKFMQTKDYQEFRRGLMVAQAQAFNQIQSGNLAIAQQTTEGSKQALMGEQVNTEKSKQGELEASKSYTETKEYLAPYELGASLLGSGGSLIRDFLTLKQRGRNAKQR